MSITQDENKVYQNYRERLQVREGYHIDQVDLVEFVMLDRLRKNFDNEQSEEVKSDRKITPDKFVQKKTQAAEATRCKILELKRMLNFAFQADVNTELGCDFYDLDNYEVEEHDNLPAIPGTESQERKNITFKPKIIDKILESGENSAKKSANCSTG